jgi:hypothetical protein
MSGSLYIMPTYFKDLASGTETFGVRVFDDEQNTYDNRWIREVTDPEELMEEIINTDNLLIAEMIEDALEYEETFVVYNKSFTSNQIKEILKIEDIVI